MKLIKCYVENFGLLHGCEFSFSKGINCCHSENGTGKTTLTAFIEAMLYGIGDTRKQLLDENPRKKYNPWQGGKYGGSLTIEVGKRKYTIERSFGSKAAEDTFRLIDAVTGKESHDYDENIGESLFGIDRDGFLRTVFLSERNLQGKNENKSISAKLSDLVGVDGDVGGYDDAVKLLEERRRFYYKKGNTGEIANVKERIGECKRRLDRISVLSEEIKAKEARLVELRTERAGLVTLEAEQRKKLAALAKAKERQSNEERYAAMLGALKTEKEKLAAAKEFFAAGVPNARDIDEARDAYAEAERIKREAFSGADDEEYIALRRFFGKGTDFVELAEMERSASLLTEKEGSLLRIKEGRDPATVKMKTLFKNGAPTMEQLERAERLGKKGSALMKIIGMAVGILLVATGLLINGGAAKYAAIGLGAVAFIIAVISLAKPTKSKELLSFIKEYCSDDFKSPREALDEIRSNIALYEQLDRERSNAVETLEEEIAVIKRRLFSFLEKFPSIDAPTISDSINHIKLQYSKYYSLGRADAINETSKLEKLRRSEQLAAAVNAFISKYPTVSKNPFAEMRERLNEYNYLLVTVQRMEGECDSFAVRYGVTGVAATSENESESVVNNTLAQISARIDAVSREYTLLEREISLAQGEIDGADEIRSDIAELEELLVSHTQSLEIIRKTSLYLKEACDNITSAYLGKTKSRFEEYSRAIAGIEGEYSISTDFEVAKSERGASHSTDAYSRGTRDLYALAMRLALVDALYEKEAPFIILDDPFIALDDAKIERAKTVLKTIARDKQILYFTCSKSRAIE